jgi:phosphohistidine phosphatase
MKRLLLLRHAKSSWGDPGTDDHERPLNRRGEKSADRMGAWLRAQRIAPDLVLCSTSRRTRQTLDALMPFHGETPPVELLPALYLAGAPGILERVRAVADSVKCLMVIGHNPGFEQLAQSLAAEGEAEALAKLTEKYPTGALADLRFTVTRWKAVGPGQGGLAAFIRPRDLD